MYFLNIAKLYNTQNENSKTSKLYRSLNYHGAAFKVHIQNKCMCKLILMESFTKMHATIIQKEEKSVY